MMRIDPNIALTLAAVIRSALDAIARIENHVSIQPGQLESRGVGFPRVFHAQYLQR